jgi:thiol reductant ABC exporter CydD subunit/thiol reductant ABC exporter CydC subunit
LTESQISGIIQVMNLDRKLFEWARPARILLAATTLCGYGGGLLAIAQAWLLSSLIAGVFLSVWNLEQGMAVLVGMLWVFAGRALLNWASETTGAAAAVRIKNDLRERLMAHLAQLGPAYLQGQQAGELVSTTVQGVEALDAFYSQYLPQVVLAVLIPVSILFVVFPIDLLSGLVFLLTGPLIPLFMVLIGKTAETVTSRQYVALGRMSAFFLDTLQGLATLKQLNQSQTRVEQIATVSERYRQKTMEVLRLTFLSALALELAATLSTAVVAVQIGLRLLYGQLDFQPAFFILILAPEFYLPLRLLGQRFHAGAAGAASARRIRGVLDIPSPFGRGQGEGSSDSPTLNFDEKRPSPYPLPKGEGIKIPSAILLNNITFQYPNRSESALSDLTLELRSGQLTALVGESGAGKSTLAYLLLGFLQPQSGTLCLAGDGCCDLSPQDWRSLIAWVPQQPYLFQDTIAANIRLGKPDATLAEVIEAARLAGLDDFVQSLPQGYDTRVGDQGARLSGGQAQRLALARACLKNAPIWILDEPTAQLDPALEMELAATIATLCRDRIALLIAHRPASLRHADRVIVLAHGRVVEQGSPGDLLLEHRRSLMRSFCAFNTGEAKFLRRLGRALQPRHSPGARKRNPTSRNASGSANLSMRAKLRLLPQKSAFCSPSLEGRGRGRGSAPFPVGDSRGRGSAPFPVAEGRGRGSTPFPVAEGQGRGSAPFPVAEGQGRGSTPFPVGEGRGEVLSPLAFLGRGAGGEGESKSCDPLPEARENQPTILRLLSFLRPLSGWVALSVLLAAAAIASNIGLLGASAYLIAQAALHPSVAALQVAIVGVRFFGIARSGLRYLERLVSHSANFRLLSELRTWFYRKLEPLAPAILIETQRGDLLDRLVADIDGLEDFYVRVVAPPLTALLVTVGMGLFLGIPYPPLGGILVIGLGLSGVGVPWLAAQLSRRPGAALVAARARLASGLVDAIQGLPDLLAYGRAGDHFVRLRESGRITGTAQVRLAAWGGLANSLNGLLTHLTLWLILWLAIPWVRSGALDGVTLAVIALLTLASFESTLPLGPAAQRLESALQSARRLFEIANARPAVTAPPQPAPPPTDAGLRIRALTFRYADSLTPALDSFSLDLPPGKRIGIIGPSGAGKSTLFNLLLRFWDYSQGSLVLAGRELREYAFEDVRRCLAVIAQNPALFSGTIRSNLLLAHPGASSQDLEQVLAQVHLQEWLAHLPDGLDTWIGERGLQVSGGERQRLAIARALLQDAPLWLLDEPTAHLDPQTRQAVAAMLQAVTRGRSLIWITHELSELDTLDEIIVLQDGRILEQGPPSILAARAGWYARWRAARHF